MCVHGLPLSIWQSLASFSVWLVLFFGALFAFFLRKHSWRTLLVSLKTKLPDLIEIKFYTIDNLYWESCNE